MQKVSKYKTANSYALAWLEAAKDNQNEEKVLAEVQMLLDDVSAHSDIWCKFLKASDQNTEQMKILNELVEKFHFSDITVSVLKLICENRRLNFFKLILEEFVHLYYQDKGIIEVNVDCAAPISDIQDKRLRNVLKQKLKAPIVLNYQIKPEVLGGLAVQFDSFLIDDTLKNKLRRVKEVMLSNKACDQ